MDTRKNYLIVDDEAPAHEVLKSHIAQYDDSCLIHHAYNGLEAIQKLAILPIDVLFLDIEMPKISGLEVLQNNPQRPPTIMTTAYTEFAFEAYQFDAVDYLQKPISFARFVKSMSKIYPQKINLKTHITLFIDKNPLEIALDQVSYIEAMGNYVKIHINKQKPLIIHQTLKGILQEIEREDFIQISKFAIINKQFIKQISGNFLELENGIILSIGRQYKELLIHQMK